MKVRENTKDRILNASRLIFNEKGYAAASLKEIASLAGISQGNLSYHFPTKSDLALGIALEVRELRQQRRTLFRPGPIADDYVNHLLFAMTITWENRFLLRDRVHFEEKVGTAEAHLAADKEDLKRLHLRIESDGLFRKGAIENMTIFSNSIWVMSRYWIDYLREFEGFKNIDWKDQQRGVDHHFALLLPCLTTEGKELFRDALKRADEQY